MSSEHDDGRRGVLLAGAATRGVVAGLVGVAAMTLAEKVEQRFTGRPSSYVPARTLRVLLGRPPELDDRAPVWNHVMHWGTGAALGALRGVWSVVGIRGAAASAAHGVVRLATDQTLENATGVGAPPGRWPRGELVLDVAHKALYAAVTGLASDRIIGARLVGRYGDETGTAAGRG